LTAETVIEPIEDAEDYRAFEEAVTADYDSVSAVERELILRLASLLRRLRGATSHRVTPPGMLARDDTLPPIASLARNRS
jgi:hypothetical protein